MTPTRIIIHNTANDASADNEIAYMIGNANEVSFHYAVDDNHVVQGIEENRNTWNAGDGNGVGNRQGISIEICYSKSGGAKFDKAERNAAEFAASILKRYGWGIDKITKHQDYNGKYCPHRTLDNGWQRFIDIVSSYMTVPTPAPVNVVWVWDDSVKGWRAKRGQDNVFGWMFNDNKWYYLGSDGVMKTGWIKDGNTWYYCKPNSGEMLTGWLWDEKEKGWYYLNPANGAMVK